MPELNISRSLEIPDGLRVARAQGLPNLGARMLFFSGGSALNETARALKSFTHNSAHLITPFDSGGSSQVLRQAFDMPAVGDLRSRLMALADETVLGQPDIFRLFSYRLSRDAGPEALAAEYQTLLAGRHPLMQAVTQPMRSLILTQLAAFDARRPVDFDFRHASVGNLILTGGYFANGKALEPVLFLMSKMVAVQGTVRAVVDDNLQIGADLADGSRVIGQRELSGKELAPLAQPIRRLFLAHEGREVPPADCPLPKRNRRLIEQADLICYAPGSLYTSVIANLLPEGVGRTVASRNVPKVYVPSLGPDPECPGLDLADQVGALLSALRADAGSDCPAEALISCVLCDKEAVSKPARQAAEKTHGVPCVAAPLSDGSAKPRYDPQALCKALVSFT
jgi:CofD-related protein of GAK system